MAKRHKLTNNSDETEIAALISGDTVFAIPYFQRAYKWKPERLKQLNRDILSLVDGSADIHFLGAIIVHGRRTNPSDPDVYDVIDGQQRITTLILYLAAIVKTLCENKEYDEAAGLFLKYLAIGRDTQLASNLKLHSCKEDRTQLNYVFKDLLNDKTFRQKVSSFKAKLLPASGADKGALRNNYRAALRFLEDQVKQEGIERLRAIYQAMLENMSVVQIDVWDPTNGPKIFDSLNSRQEPMTTGDLVRNEVFAKVANEDAEFIEQIDQEFWQPFYTKFQQAGKNLFDSYFFPYGLIQNPNLNKSEVFSALREAWRGSDNPELIIKELAEYQDAFLDIECGTNLQKHDKAVGKVFKQLYNAGIPNATYPFLMQLSNAVRTKQVTGPIGMEIIGVIESFLVRRAICGHEPTGLHSVFKRLWTDCKGAPSKDLVVQEIRKHKTVVWPSNEDVKRAVEKRPLYGSAIAPYVIREYDTSLEGDAPANPFWIEHVLPENPVKEWFQLFKPEQHALVKDLFANLIPLTKEMNASLGNKPYGAKKDTYLKDSAFKSARVFAQRHKTWTPEILDARGRELSAWALKRWPV